MDKTVLRPSLDDIIAENKEFQANVESLRSRGDYNEQFGLFTFCQIVANYLQNGTLFSFFYTVLYCIL